MQRTLSIAFIALSIVIGTVIGIVAFRVTGHQQSTIDRRSADPTLGYAFYEGIDQLLAGGTADALEATVSEGFVDHGSDRMGDWSTSDLIEHLMAFRESFPGMRFVVDDIQATPGTLVASIEPVRPPETLLAGVPLSVEPVAGGYEMLRVQSGRVTERWSSGLPELELRAFDDAGFTAGAAFGASIRLERIDLPRAGMVTLTMHGQSIVMVESGALRIERRWMKSSHEAHSDVVLLETGQATALAASARIQLEPNGEDRVRLLYFSMQRSLPVEPATPLLTGGATSTLLWANHLPPHADVDWKVMIGVMQVSSDFDGTLAPNGAQLLVVCEHGSLQLIDQGGEILALGDDYSPSEPHGNTIDAGSAVSESGAKSLRLQSKSGASVWFLAIIPNDTTENGVAPGTPTASKVCHVSAGHRPARCVMSWLHRVLPTAP